MDSTVAAGEYTGTAVITMNAKIIELPVSIRIYDVQLPEQVHARSSFDIWYDYIDEGEGTGSLSMDEAYFNYLVSKRMMPTSVSDNLRTDIDTYVNYMAENLAGNPKISAYGIHYDVDRSSGINRLDSAYMTDILTAMIEKNIALRQAGDTSIDLFEKGFFYFGRICDEPREGSSDEELVLECDQILADAKESLVGLLADYPDLQESFLAIPHIVTAHRYDGIDNDMHTYCPRLDKFNEADYTDESVWWYGCMDPETPYPTYHLNDELITSRVLSWMQYDYNVAGNLYWCVNYYYDRAADGTLSVRNFWSDPSPLIGQPGDGYLLYPGKDYEVYGPIGTMRLESIREGNEDYEYFWLFQQNIEKYNEENGTSYDADTLLQTFFAGLYEGMYPSTDSALFAQQRIRLLEVLEQMNTDLDAAVESLI